MNAYSVVYDKASLDEPFQDLGTPTCSASYFHPWLQELTQLFFLTEVPFLWNPINLRDPSSFTPNLVLSSASLCTVAGVWHALPLLTARSRSPKGGALCLWDPSEYSIGLGISECFVGHISAGPMCTLSSRWCCPGSVSRSYLEWLGWFQFVWICS